MSEAADPKSPPEPGAPADPLAAAARGHALLAEGRLAEAEAALREATRAVPLMAQALHDLGLCHYRRGDAAGAASLLGQAVALAPRRAEYHANHGVMLRAAGRPAEAEAAARRALALEPRHPNAASNLGNLLRSDGRTAEALEAYRQALTARPDFHEARLQYASTLMDLGRLDEAEAELRRLVEARPEVPAYRIDLSKVLQRRGRLAEAEAACSAALALRPTAAFDDANAAYLSIVGHLGRLDRRNEIRSRLEAALAADLDRQPVEIGAYKRFAYLMPYFAFADAAHLRILSRLGAAMARQHPPTPGLADPGPATPLRVGYLSGDFGDHPIGHLLSPVFEAHDHARVQTFLYSIGNRGQETSPFRRRMKAAAFRFRELEGQPVSACLAAVRADRPHVLVDLNGYLSGGLPELLACRAAPIQIHWIMHLGGMPAPFVDYTITDRVVVPEPVPDPARGALIRLPEAFQAGDRHPVPVETPPRAAFGLPETGFVFCAFNNRLKIDDRAFACWLRILAGVPGSVLWLSAAAEPVADEMLREMAAAHGIDPARLVFARRVVDKGAHLARHRHAGLFLDTFAFSAATTATDALWSGLPVLTRRMDVCHGRIGESLLRAVGCPDLVATDDEDYVARAVAIGRDPVLALRLRGELAARLPTAPYFDATRFARLLEAAYATAWARAAAKQPPAGFDVPPPA